MKSLLASAAALFISTQVMAADAVSETPAPPAAVEVAPAFSWSGGYVGIHGGYGWLDGKFSAGGLTANEKFNGGRAGGFVGWNFDVGHNVVLGLEGDLNYDWNKRTFSGIDIGTDVSGSARSRVGYAFDRALIFAAGGWTATRGYLENSGADGKKTFNGWTIGAGVDYAVTNNIFVRGEYRYNDFGSKDLSGIDTKLKQNVVNLGVGVKF
ncbi:outer membrane protein [Rhizobium paknamense]|uniref:outer membrane protein n=1 Tax=Rhizobium paknamense TaxID=1206817 RepID=UPI0027D83416|nr:outer membrane protein [Rhizobium paknamense]